MKKQSVCGNGTVKKEAEKLQGKPDMQVQGALMPILAGPQSSTQCVCLV